jgi:hypothetical protein
MRADTKERNMKKTQQPKISVKEKKTSVKGALHRPGISPDELYRLKVMPVSRNAIYDACNRGDIECFRVGKKIIIPTAPLRRKLGMEAA